MKNTKLVSQGDVKRFNKLVLSAYNALTQVSHLMNTQIRAVSALNDIEIFISGFASGKEDAKALRLELAKSFERNSRSGTTIKPGTFAFNRAVLDSAYWELAATGHRPYAHNERIRFGKLGNTGLTWNTVNLAYNRVNAVPVFSCPIKGYESLSAFLKAKHVPKGNEILLTDIVQSSRETLKATGKRKGTSDKVEYGRLAGRHLAWPDIACAFNGTSKRLLVPSDHPTLSKLLDACGIPKKAEPVLER